MFFMYNLRGRVKQNLNNSLPLVCTFYIILLTVIITMTKKQIQTI